jgi:Zn-dependent metalloprotease
MKKNSLLIILFFSSCTPTPELINVRWSGSGAKPDLSKITTKDNPPLIHESQGEEISTYEQKVSGFKVAGSFVKIIKKNSNTVFQSAQVVQGASALDSFQALRLDSKKENIWNKFLDSHPLFASEKLVGPLEVVIETKPEVRPVILATLEKKSGLFHQLKISKTSELESDQIVGSQLTDLIESMSTAYPRGPKKSALSAVLLNRKNQSVNLSDGNFEMFSASPAKINLSEPLEFPVSDDRFDQVQAFYYSQQIMDWFKKDLKQDYLGRINITTQLGFPEKTNAAFYFQNQIRLGQGDNETYSHIAWDPTIVMHETSHALIDAISHLPFQGEGGSINEGYADVFTTFFLESPLLGENSYLLGPYKRTVDQNLKLSEKNGGLYHDSAIVSGFFWNLKKQIGADASLQLAVRVLNRLGPNSNFEDFKLTLHEQANEVLSEEQLKKADGLMKERELQ